MRVERLCCLKRAEQVEVERDEERRGLSRAWGVRCACMLSSFEERHLLNQFLIPSHIKYSTERILTWCCG